MHPTMSTQPPREELGASVAGVDKAVSSKRPGRYEKDWWSLCDRGSTIANVQGYGGAK